jgi:uncharacterized protein
MSSELTAKYKTLIEKIREAESVLVAFSGGVDSSFLLKACHEAIGGKVKAVTVVTPYIPNWEVEEAKNLASALGVEHEMLELDIPESISDNPENRCYLCKKQIFSAIIKTADEQGFNVVSDGSNLDDTKEYRPGMKALEELGVRSLLLESGLTKSDIRELSKTLNLPTWDKPAYACLLTRIPYGTPLNEKDFEMIEEAETYLMNKGFRAVRVRKHGDIGRIEIDRSDRKSFLDEKLMDEVSQKLKGIGFKYVAMELTGYERGGLDA